MRGKLKTIAHLALGAIFVYWFVHKLDWTEVWVEVGKANWGQLGFAVALLVGTYFVRSLRWRALLAPMASASFTALFRATAVGFTALFLVGRAGELIVRPAVLSVKEPIHPSASYATVMIERVYDMVMVVIFFAVDLALFQYVSSDAEAMHVFGLIRASGFLLLVVAAAGIYGLSVFRTRREAVLAHIERRLGRHENQPLVGALARGVISLLKHISQGLAVLHDLRNLAVTVSYTVLMWGMVAFAHLLVIRAFGVTRAEVPVTGAVFVMGLSMIGSVVPTPGAAAGPFHAATAAALAFQGVEQNKAASVAIVLHLVIFAPATLFGLFFVLKDGLSFARLMRLGSQQPQRADEAQVVVLGPEGIGRVADVSRDCAEGREAPKTVAVGG